jgi:hypothetical protein
MSAHQNTEEHPPLGESDWDDQDLLTIDEASERLQAEITQLRASLAQPDGANRDQLANRLRSMERAHESLKQGPSPLAKITPNH